MKELTALGLVGEIKAHHREALKAGQDFMENALSAGALLSKAKGGVAHGEWEDFVEVKCGITLRVAQQYMKACKDLDALSKTKRVSLLKSADSMKGLTKALSDAAPKPPASPKPPPSESQAETHDSSEQGDPCHTDAAAAVDSEANVIVVEDNPCANCGGIEFLTVEDGGDNCAKCNHPYGEPAGDLDDGDDGWKTQRTKTVKTIEAALRAVDDLHNLKPHREAHDVSIETLKSVLQTVREW